VASPDNPTQRYLYRARLDGSQLQRVTPEDRPGIHRYEISPGGSWAIHRWSRFDTPPQVRLVRLPEHQAVRELVDNRELAERFESLGLPPVEFFRVEIGEGVCLDGFCLKPSDFDPQKKYPLLIYVYGEPAGQTVLDRWGGKTHLWHRMLAERGYVVMSFDNRGTPAPRGRDWRKVVYRQVGILAPAEQAAALRQVLAQRPYLDPQRVGIWGWSGGGSMALNAIFKYPKLYHTAMAVAPVADQRYYDTIYQERYMGLPDDNADGYQQGSAIAFAKQLEGNLLLVHGTADDNVHYQITELLIDELIRHNKRFTMMAYPNRGHAIHEGKNTTLHLRELLTAYLTQHLPPGAR
jgi:dipeptidyl-peptidase 4